MKDQINLNNEQLKLLSSHWENLSFENDFDFHYENQLLKGAIAVTEGKVEILQNSRLVDVIMPGSVVGLKSLKDNIKVKYQLRIKAGSVIVLVGKSGLNELNNLIGSNAAR